MRAMELMLSHLVRRREQGEGHLEEGPRDKERRRSKNSPCGRAHLLLTILDDPLHLDWDLGCPVLARATLSLPVIPILYSVFQIDVLLLYTLLHWNNMIHERHNLADSFHLIYPNLRPRSSAQQTTTDARVRPYVPAGRRRVDRCVMMSVGWITTTSSEGAASTTLAMNSGHVE